MASAEPLVEDSDPIKNSRSWWKTCVVAGSIAAAMTVASSGIKASRLRASITGSESSSNKSNITRVAFIGNSMMYFNDSPRFFSHLAGDGVVQDSCLRGFASLAEVYYEGNGMEEKFNTSNALKTDGSFDLGAPTVQKLLKEEEWDYVVMNDYSQAPARFDMREETEKILKTFYGPHLKSIKATPVLMMTAAYHGEAKNSSDLGSVTEFTELLYEGYQAYKSTLDATLGKNLTKIAPVGLAYYTIYQENSTFWDKLFYIDDYHPTVYGTYLQGCVLYWTLFGIPPPNHNRPNKLWHDARRFYPPEDNIPVQFPSSQELEYLRDVAQRVSIQHGLAKH